MTKKISRRAVLAGTATVGGTTAGLLAGTPAPAAPLTKWRDGTSVPRPVAIPPSDGRYKDLVSAWNGRFIGQPDYVHVVHNAEQVEQALGIAVSAGKRVAVRSGGHCVEGFVTDPAIKVQVDMSQMTGVYFDSSRNAFVVEPGATLREVYKKLFTDWGVTVPGGTCPSVGAGGHFAGGGFGALARRSGIIPDHIYAVEVVTVTASGTPRTVIATRNAGDPNRELWWAHTGGGGGNFGVVTRYWMRSWGATGTDPTRLLPKPPREARNVTFIFPWAALNEATFSALVRNYIRWYERNSAPTSPFIRLSANMIAAHINTAPGVILTVVTDPAESDSAAMVDAFRAEVVDTVGAPVVVQERRYPWLQSTNAAGYADTGDVVGRRNKAKGAYLRSSYTDAQLAVTYRYLQDASINAPLAAVIFNAYGGMANALAPDATAVPQRDSVLKALHTIHWDDPAQDSLNLGWLRSFYRDVYADTGGVPGLNGITDGSFINYADVELADPTQNTSGIPWSSLYYKDSYPRLQRVKARWDPLNVFRHALSIELPS
ncbi:FAD-linked oxidase [Micromonospora qiuiae]|uniref:FAD-linked oxidase n=1 Tax=Micromonospora qiuiae TaxID=502268 RepID=A0ABQ4JG95_9ACTN|nr:FAD-binding protein [Micromonospora qiuiae]GIJ29513.1 FAD-linked oxidase [Micromonospora qiuiae]